jgi:hypothetical protein
LVFWMWARWPWGEGKWKETKTRVESGGRKGEDNSTRLEKGMNRVERGKKGGGSRIERE